MPRKKDEPKPLFSLKADFVESLDNFTQCSLNLYQAVDLALKLGKDKIPEPIAKQLKDAADKWRKAATSDDD